MKNKAVDTAGALYLLSWIDCVERLDVVLLEARHLQQSLIFDLRCPPLCLYLRHEEKFLWGSNWRSAIDSDAPVSHWIPDWILPYPEPIDALPKAAENSADSAAPIGERVKRAVHAMWHAGRWSKEQRRCYHSLCAIQVLKQQVLHDKLVLCRHGWSRARLHDSSAQSQINNSRAKFLVLRRGILSRLTGYVRRLGEHQELYSKAMDLGAHDYPRPLLERRRELGVYGDYLSDRTRDLLQDMDLLLDYLDVGHRQDALSSASGAPNTPENRCGKTRRTLHTWVHDCTSYNSHLQDEVNNPPRDYDYVRTHYWMPERPDLQPTIAHEMAHVALRNRMCNLKDDVLSGAEDSCSYLLRAFYYWLGQMGLRQPQGRQYAHAPLDGVVRELACDLLAASVKGFSYLYALFLELVGYCGEGALERLLELEDHAIDLSLIERLTVGHEDVLNAPRDWYLRLKLVVYWLRITHHMDLTEIDVALLDGVDGVLDELMGFLDLISAENGTAGPGDYWRKLVLHMQGIIRRSDMPYQVRRWRKQRSINEFKRDGSTGARILPRRMSSFAQPIIEFMTAHTCRVLGGVGLLPQGIDCASGLGLTLPDSVFRHTHDIPWQYSQLLARQILGSGYSDPDEFFRRVHYDADLGRELFSVGVEFAMRDAESPERRLSDSIGMVSAWLHGRQLAGFESTLNEWLGSGEESAHGGKVLEAVTSAARKGWRIKGADDQRFSARAVASAFSWKPNEPGAHRKLEELAGRLLERLCVILKDAPVDVAGYWAGLLSYLKIRGGRVGAPAACDSGGASPGSSFYKRILDALNVATDGGKAVGSLVVGRIILAGGQGVGDDGSNTLRLADALTGSALDDTSPVFRWRNRAGAGPESQDNPMRYYQILLGRYDLLGLRATQHMDRTMLPAFSKQEDVGTTGERFPTFFVRTEIALPVCLRDSPWVMQLKGRDSSDATAVAVADQVLAVIAIVLQRRSQRLDFLYRLLASADHVQYGESPEGSEWGIGKFIGKNDFVLLTDGWGDMLLVFAGEADVRLQEIFTIQDMLFEDFMVDRTELILTPKCFDWAITEGRSKGFDVFAQVRLNGAGCLQASNRAFLRDIGSFAEKGTIAVNRVAKQPGTMDFAISFGVQHSRLSDSPYAAAVRVLSQVNVDRINTHVLLELKLPNVRLGEN